MCQAALIISVARRRVDFAQARIIINIMFNASKDFIACWTRIKLFAAPVRVCKNSNGKQIKYVHPLVALGSANIFRFARSISIFLKIHPSSKASTIQSQCSLSATTFLLLTLETRSPCQHLKPSLLLHSTGRILLFYLIFYVALSAFFMAMWFLFASTLIEGRPKYELDDSIIGGNPGLGFRPMPPESNVESTLIWYQKHNPGNSEYWVNETNSFLKGEEKALTLL